VTVCSVALGPEGEGEDLHPYGEASHVINRLEGFESLDVVGNLLPDPSSFGSAYGQYAFTLTYRGRLVASGLMTALPVSGDWAGSYSPGVATIPNGTVRVMPTPAGSESGPFGPVVLMGNLGHCR